MPGRLSLKGMSQNASQKKTKHPGEFIREDILKEFGLTQEELARTLGVTRRTINQIVNGRRGISADMALRLGQFTRTSPEMWMNLQNAIDLWDAYHSVEKCIECIPAHSSSNAAGS